MYSLSAAVCRESSVGEGIFCGASGLIEPNDKLLTVLVQEDVRCCSNSRGSIPKASHNASHEATSGDEVADRACMVTGARLGVCGFVSRAATGSFWEPEEVEKSIGWSGSSSTIEPN